MRRFVKVVKIFMKTNQLITYAVLFITLATSIDAWGLTSAQLETSIRGATTGGPDFNITAPAVGSGVVKSAASFGVSTNNTGAQNYTDFLNAINYCKSNSVYELTVPPGTYKIGNYGSSYTAILNFNGFSDFIFNGQGATFLMQSKSDFIHVTSCSRVVLENYTMNWDWSLEPVQSLTEVVNIATNGTYMDLYYPYEANPPVHSLLYELDEVDGVNYDFSHQGAGIIGLGDVATNETTSLGNSTLRFYTTHSANWFYNKGVRVGQYYLLRHYSYEHPGNDVEYNDNLTFSNVTVYSTLGMGFSLLYNQYWQIIDSSLIREPGSIYHLSSASDGINNSLGYGYFKLQNDELGNCGDDNINIHDGTSEKVKVTGANTLTAENTVDWKDPYHKNDVVELRQGDYTPWNWSSILTASTNNGSSYSLVFSNNLPTGLTTNTILFNDTYNSGNYIISGCYIHDSKGKGAFLHTANGTVENNQFIRNYNPGLFIASINSYYGLGSSYGEGYNPSNIIVQNNTFDGNNIIRNNGVTDTYFPNDIVLVGQTGPEPIATYPICNNIIFEYNLVKNSTHASMEIASATNVLVENNTFENPCLTNDMTLLGCVIITNSGGVVFNNNALVIDAGVTSYKTNVYVAPSLANIFAGPFVPQTLPADWSSYDIGSVGLGGSAAYTNGTFTVNGSGADIWGTSDSFQFVYQAWSGDGQIVARVTSVQNTASSAKGALMFRETLDADSCNTTLFVSPTNGVSMQGRTVTGGSSATINHVGGLLPPQWLSLVRVGTSLFGYQSVDGINWNWIGTQTNFTATNIYVGLAVTSKSNSLLNTSTFDHVSVNGAWQNENIGDAGGSSQINYSNGVCTVAGSGTDIWSTNDDFQFLYQSCSGDKVVVARVTSVQNTASSAKGALMIRETTDANSRNTALFLSPTNGISLQGRTVTGGSSITVNHIGGLLPPQWLMLVRSSSNINGYQSVDGTNWSWIGTQTNSIASSYYIGMAVTSKNDTATNTSTFDNVSVQNAWESGDIGSVGVAGDTEIDNLTGTFTVSGSGLDIWGTNDAFQYVGQPLYGDGQIVAHVSVGSSYLSGKAGVMIRDTLSADSEDAFLFVGTNGVSFQGRTNTGGSTSTFFNVQGITAPCWLKLSRSGDSLTASYSSDGISWTLLGTQTVAMSTNAWVGLAVGSKDNEILNTATFDNVTITPTP